jgi:hypothetical protein
VPGLGEAVTEVPLLVRVLVGKVEPLVEEVPLLIGAEEVELLPPMLLRPVTVAKVTPGAFCLEPSVILLKKEQVSSLESKAVPTHWVFAAQVLRQSLRVSPALLAKMMARSRSIPL